MRGPHGGRPHARAVAGLLAVAGVLSAAPAWAQPAPAGGEPPTAAAPAADTATDPAARIALGRRVYTSLCARCHGLNLVSSGLGFDLRQFPADGEQRFRTSVLEGIRTMPGWKAVLRPGELDALWAYVGSVNGWSR